MKLIWLSEGELYTAEAENQEEQKLIDQANAEGWGTWKFLEEVKKASFSEA